MTQIQIAARNARTIRWLTAQSRELINLMREHYASDMDCPLSEICRDFTSNEELSWVYGQFGPEIDEFARLNNHPRFVTCPAAQSNKT